MDNENKNEKRYRILVVDEHEWARRDCPYYSTMRNLQEFYGKTRQRRETLTKTLDDYASHLEVVNCYYQAKVLLNATDTRPQTRPDAIPYDVLLTSLNLSFAQGSGEIDADGWNVSLRSYGYDLIFDAARLGVPFIGCWINNHPLSGNHGYGMDEKDVERFTVNSSVLVYCHWASFPRMWHMDPDVLLRETAGANIYDQARNSGKGQLLACRDLVKNWPALLNELVKDIDGPLRLEKLEGHLTQI
ncbi:MAG: hypothetical protein AABX47_08595 [Nanoarchaeota archaeon]